MINRNRFSSFKIIAGLLVSTLLITQFSQACLTGIMQFQENDTDRKVTLLGMIHREPTAETVFDQRAQLITFEDILKKRESVEHNKKLRVMVEHPYALYSGDQIPTNAKAPSCGNSLMNHEFDPNFQSTIFENIEERKCTGAAFVCLDKPFCHFQQNQKIVINNRVIALDNFVVKDVKDEYQTLKEFANQHKYLFKECDAKKLFDVSMHSSQEAALEFDRTIKQLDVSDHELFLDLIKRAEQSDATKFSISDSFVVQDSHTLKTALSAMLEVMTNPLFEFYIFSRIANAKEDQAIITGASHANMLKLLLERSNFKRTAAHGSFINVQAPLLNEADLKPLLGSHTF